MTNLIHDAFEAVIVLISVSAIGLALYVWLPYLTATVR